METSWLMNGLGFAKKIRSTTQSFTLQFGELFAKPHAKCTNCDCGIDISNVSLVWPALPAGVKFDPTDVELLQHLEAKSSQPNSVSHTLIDEFIPTINEEEGICYTHPKNLPGMKMDGSCLHFFNRLLNAYDTGKRKRRRIIATGDICDGVANASSRWHKTGASKPVFDENGVIKGWKKILTLYRAHKKVGDKSEKENWVMHQYNLGVKEHETNGEFVVCKIFYQSPLKKNDKSKLDAVIEPDASVAKINPRTPMTDPPHPRRLHNSSCITEQYTPIQEDQEEEECGTSKMKVEAAESSAGVAELPPTMPTSDEPERTPMTDPPQDHRLNISPCNTEQYTPIQGEQECGTSKMKVEAAECSACCDESSATIPTSDEPQRTPMTYPPKDHRLNISPCNTEQYTHIQVGQGEEECSTSKVKVEAAESSAGVAELSPPAIPTSDEPMQPTVALDAGLDTPLPIDGPSMELFDELPDLSFTGTPSGGHISLDDIIFGPQDGLGDWPYGFPGFP